MLETPIEDTLIVAAHARLHEVFAAQSVRRTAFLAPILSPTLDSP